MLTPKIPFKDNDFPDELTAHKVVNSMSEEQLRYAMYAVLVVLFGSPECNSEYVLASVGMARTRFMAEGHLLLMQVGMNRSCPQEVAMMEEEFSKTFA